MSLAETIYHHSLRLPEPAAQEVLDFIEFEVSPVYQALMKIGFIGCMNADEQLSARYKDQIDFAKKYNKFSVS